MSRTYTETAAFIISSIQELGLELHPESRLMQMCRLFSAGGTIEPDHPQFETALEAIRDLQQLEFVFDQVQNNSVPGFRTLVAKSLKDSVFPQENLEHSPGRDAQFELYVCAVCQSAGLLPIEREEPDVTCTVEGVRFGIAAKRIKNISNLKERTKKAALQIEQSKLPGIIALDSCLAFNRDNRRLTSPITDAEFGLLWQ